eukprot:gene26422-34585_t
MSNNFIEFSNDQLHLLSTPGNELGSNILNGSINSENFILHAKQIFPELGYFRGSADATADAAATNLSSSEIEYRRTLGAMLSVFWIVSDKYDDFTKAQEPGEKLSRDSWERIRNWAKTTVCLNSPEAVDAMLSLMAIHDLGKINDFRNEFAGEFKDHDAAMNHIIATKPGVLPTFCRLNEHYQQVVRSTLIIDFNFGQLLQAENIPQSLLSIKTLVAGEGDATLAFYLFHIFVDMAGIKGADSLDGSLFMTENMYLNYELGLRILSELTSKDPCEVYDSYLIERAMSQGLPFDVGNADERAVVRLASLARVFDPVGGSEVLAAWTQLDAETRDVLRDHLNRTGIADQHLPAFILYYSPAFMESCRKNTKVGLVQGMTFMAKIFLAAQTAFAPALKDRT